MPSACPSPLSVYVDTYDTGRVDEDRLSKVLQELINLSPRGIREHLGLNKPIYARTSAYGHFGRAPEADGGFSWERTDLVDRSAVAPSPERRSWPARRRAGRSADKVYGRRRGRRLRVQKTDLLETLLPRLAIEPPDEGARLDPVASVRTARRAMSGWRSASAAASIWPPMPRPIPTSA